jgi:hypothetical protein
MKRAFLGLWLRVEISRQSSEHASQGLNPQGVFLLGHRGGGKVSLIEISNISCCPRPPRAFLVIFFLLYGFASYSSIPPSVFLWQRERLVAISSVKEAKTGGIFEPVQLNQGA